MIAGRVCSAGGKSELHRAGWSLTATGGTRGKVPQKNTAPPQGGSKNGEVRAHRFSGDGKGMVNPSGQDQIGERLRAARLMFSGSVARGGRQLPSQMNDHRRGEGNRTAEQNSAYDFLRACLF